MILGGAGILGMQLLMRSREGVQYSYRYRFLEGLPVGRMSALLFVGFCHRTHICRKPPADRTTSTVLGVIAGDTSTVYRTVP